MTTADDDLHVQDARDERLLTGAPTGEDPAVVDLVETLRATASAAAPAPSAALAALLRDGLAPVTAVLPEVTAEPHRAHLARRPGTRRRLDRRTGRGLGVAAKVALGAGLAVVAFGGAAAAGVGPEAVRAPATRVVDAVRDLLGTGDVPDVTPTSPTSPVPAPAVTGVPSPGGEGRGAEPTAPESAAPSQGGNGQQSPGESRSETGELRSGTAPGPDAQPGRAATPAPSGGAGEPRGGEGTQRGLTPAPTQPGRSGDARG